MKKQASDQQFHDRRYQERKRAEAAKQPPKKKPVSAPTKGNSEGIGVISDCRFQIADFKTSDGLNDAGFQSAI